MEQDTCNSKKKVQKKSFKESLKGKLFDALETVVSYIDVETIIRQVKINDKKEQRFGVVMTPFIKFEVIEIIEVNVRNSSFLSFIFTCLCITKPLLIRILKR